MQVIKRFFDRYSYTTAQWQKAGAIIGVTFLLGILTGLVQLEVCALTCVFCWLVLGPAMEKRGL
jgi:hypothetical protein